MKYYQYSRRKNGGAGLYIIMACGLIAVGAIAWFAVSRIAGNTVPPKNSSSQLTKSEYSTPDESYNDITPSDITSDVANSVSDIPYTSSEQENTEPEKAEPKQAPIMPVDGKILKEYNDAALQYSATYGDLRLHTAVDIEANSGTTVKAAADGTVIATDESASLGKTVTIDHGNGIIMKYCGLDNVVVSTGKKVSMGDPIAVVGSIPSECADKSHIHLEATKNGKIVSPMDIIGKIPE